MKELGVLLEHPYIYNSDEHGIANAIIFSNGKLTDITISEERFGL